MVFDVTTPELAKEMMSYFNDFHDGFIMEIKIAVTPDPPPRYGFCDQRVFSVSITFAHDNYQAVPEVSTPNKVLMICGNVTHIKIDDFVDLVPEITGLILKQVGSGWEIGDVGEFRITCQSLKVSDEQAV
jgi:hypothetical protein